MDEDWFIDALNNTDPLQSDSDEEEECPICGDDAGYSCPCIRDE